MVLKYVYQPTLDTLELKKDKSADYVVSWKSKGVHTYKHKPLYTAFLQSVKSFGYRVGIQFDNGILAVEQKCLFRATNIVKTSDKKSGCTLDIE